MHSNDQNQPVAPTPSVTCRPAGVTRPDISFTQLYEIAGAGAETRGEYEASVRALVLLAAKTGMFTISGTDERRRARRLAQTTEPLPCPTSASTADQCREMGIELGDVIEGRESYPGGWNEARLKLLWLGEDVAVWSEQSRDSRSPEWDAPEERSNWTLDCREWRRVLSPFEQEQQ
ncbi:hypothetical protein F6X40_34600 [Paraburkholderia sp. UCT31]|uniref:DUF7241 domain-containing protein n=1 Tax=Paraburkholderia sp. UCT31 TaxID=2615209 RepID=UPI001655E57C|nr:hypothetical protein [Paraburkholderia sp. UCT31]MBC8741694.1 hypothetical protein [Paraburkholderia sp. UCT31]